MASKRTRRGRRILLVALLLFLAGALFLYDQQNRIQPETVDACSPRLPAAFDGFRVVQISDLHGKMFGADNERLLKAVAGLEPDLIAITGDLVDDPAQLSMIPALARALSGIDDPNGPYDQKSPQELMEEIRAEQGDPYILLLAHRNEYVETYAACGADLILCGHVHGGIIRLPFTDGLIDNTRRRLFPSYTAGLYPLDSGGVLMVSRGLGNGTGVPRLFNRPHLPVIVLRTSLQ